MSRRASAGAEQRQASRLRALKGAQMIFNDGASIIDCTLRDISPGGARLQVASTVGVPERFTLLIVADGGRHACRVAWRRLSEIGVAFEAS